MRKILLLFVTAVTLAGCTHNLKFFKASPEEVIWKNDFVKFRTDKDKGNRIAFDAFVTPSNGKTIEMPSDTVALGYGASSPIGDLGFYKPDKGASMAEVLSLTDQEIVLHLHYDSWDIYDAPVTLDKQITLKGDNPVMKVIDYYTGAFELLNVAAGVTLAGAGTVHEIDNGFSIRYPSGITALICMPDADECFVRDSLGTVLVRKAVRSDEPLRYYVGLSDKGESYLLEQLDNLF